MARPTKNKGVVITAAQRENAFLRGREDPGTWLDSGMLHVVDASEDAHRPSDELGRLVPMTLTPSQRFLWRTVAMKRSQGLPSRLIIGKDRRRKVTTFFALWCYVSCATRSQERAVLIAHLDKTVTELFKMGKIAHDNNSYFKDAVKQVVRRVDTMGFAGSVGPYHVKDSSYYCTNASERTVGELRGLMVTMMHKTECPNFHDLEALNTASSATKSKSKHSVDVEESTFEGSDNYFAESFMQNWKAQGEKNWDQPGYIVGKSAREAIFFPWYTNEVNRVKFAGGLEPGDLIGVLNDEEQEIKRIAEDYWTRTLIERRESGDVYEMARLIVAESLLFRRAKLKPLFPDFAIPGNREDSYSSITRFYQEYPMTPGQAIGASGKRAYYGPSILQFVRDTSQKQPVFTGFIHPEIGSGFRLEANAAGDFIVWKWPHECRGTVDLCIDPHVGRENTGLSEEDCDMYWASSFEWSTGQQVCEYFTFDGPESRNPRMWAIAKFLGSKRDQGGNWHLYQGRLPLVAEESLSGCPTMRYLQRSCDYPSDKLFRDVTNVSKEYAEQTDVLGWIPQRRKKFAVEKSFDYLLNSLMAHRGTLVSDDAKIRLRTVSSKRLAEQMGYFISKDDKEFHAERKGMGGDKSRDDAVTTLYISAYVQETAIMRNAGDFLKVSEDEGEIEYKIVNGQELSYEEACKHEMRMIQSKKKKTAPCSVCSVERVHGMMDSGDWQCLTCGSLMRKVRSGVSMYRSMADYRRQVHGDE